MIDCAGVVEEIWFWQLEGTTGVHMIPHGSMRHECLAGECFRLFLFVSIVLYVLCDICWPCAFYNGSISWL